MNEKKDLTLRSLLFAIQFWGERGMIPMGDYVHWKKRIEDALEMEHTPGPSLAFPNL